MLHARWREDVISSKIMQASESATQRVAVTHVFGDGSGVVCYVKCVVV